MEKKGIVKYVDKHNIVISAYKKTSCDKCKSCTEGGKFESECKFRIKGEKNIKKGDTVLFTIKDKKILGYSFLIYIFPMIGFFLGYYLRGRIISNSNEIIKIIGSFWGMAVFYFIVFITDKFFGEIVIEDIRTVNK